MARLGSPLSTKERRLEPHGYISSAARSLKERSVPGREKLPWSIRQTCPEPSKNVKG